MEGISTHVYKGIKSYWKHRGYKRLNKNTYNIINGQTNQGSESGPNPVKPTRKRRFFRVKINRKMRICKKFVGLPKKLLTSLRDAYVNMMLHVANTRLMLGGGATGFGGSLGYEDGSGNNYRGQLKEYDEKMIIEVYKSLMIGQGQIGSVAKISYQQQLRNNNSCKISISTR